MAPNRAMKAKRRVQHQQAGGNADERKRNRREDDHWRSIGVEQGDDGQHHNAQRRHNYRAADPAGIPGNPRTPLPTPSSNPVAAPWLQTRPPTSVISSPRVTPSIGSALYGDHSPPILAPNDGVLPGHMDIIHHLRQAGPIRWTGKAPPESPTGSPRSGAPTPRYAR